MKMGTMMSQTRRPNWDLINLRTVSAGVDSSNRRDDAMCVVTELTGHFSAQRGGILRPKRVRPLRTTTAQSPRKANEREWFHAFGEDGKAREKSEANQKLQELAERANV